MKKHLIVSMVAIMSAGAAYADGLYISPRVAWSQMRVSEERTEKKAVDGAWAEFDGNKHESWDDHKNKLAPKLAFGYEYDAHKYGVFGAEIEYGQSSAYFNPTRSDFDFDGNALNDSDSRDFKYSESTLSLNFRYGYSFNKVTPFVSVGIGYSAIDSENNFRSGTYWWETRDSEQNVSWNIGVGIEVPVTERLAFSLAYRYTDLGTVKYTNRMYHEKGNANGIERNFYSDVNLKKNEVIAGAKISF